MKSTQLSHYLKFALLLAILCSSITTYAYDFEVDGIYYSFNVYENEVFVTNSPSTNKYTGSITIPEVVTYNGTTYSVTSIGGNAFEFCSNLTNITIGNSVTTIGGGAFCGCSRLSSVILGNSVTNIYGGAFSYCNELISITIPNSATNIDNSAFNDCSGLTSIIVESGNPKYDSRDNCNAIIETASNTLITGCMNTIIPNSVTAVGDWSFSGCKELNGLTIPNSVTTIGDWSFCGCGGLTSLTIGYSVIEIGNYAFTYCWGLSEIYSLSMTPPNISSNTFDDCYGATLYVPIEAVNAYKSANYWKNFTNIVGIDYVPQAIPFEVDGIYYNITSETNQTVEVTFKDNNYASYSGDVIIPSTIIYNGKTYTVTAIGDSAFYECMINDVTIPETVTYIGEAAFGSIYCFHSITCLATTPPNMNGSFGYHSEGHIDPAWAIDEDGVFISDLYLYVPDEAYDSYKMLNDVYHYFSFIIKIGAGKTQAPVVEHLMNYDIILPSEGELHTCKAYYNTCGAQPYSEFIIGSWWDDDEFEYPYVNEWRSLVEITYAYSIDAGKEPSEIVKAVTNSYSNFQGVRYYYDFIEDGLCYNLGCEVTSDQWYEWYRMYNDDGDYEIVYENHQKYYSGDIIIPSAVRFGDVKSISSSAFKNSEELNSVFVPYSIASIGACAFTGCPNLNCLQVENENTTFDSRDNCNAIIETANNKLIVGCNNTIIPSTVVCIGDSAFSGSCITKLCIPNTITSIGRGAFWQCSSLSTLLLTGEGAWSGGALDVAVQRLDIASGITAIPGLKVNPREVYSYAAAPPTCDENTFTDYTGTLHVPESSLAAYFTAPYWCNFANIVGDAVELTALTLNKDSAEILVDEQLTLNATIQPANANIDSITWESSNEEIATVVNGVVTAKALGECDIIVTCLDKRAVCHIKVVEQVTTITLDQHRASLLPNHILTLTPTVTPEPTDLVVTSSNPSVAAARLANGNVQVVGVSVGNAIIKVSSADGKAVADSCFVNVYTEAGDVDGDGFVKIDDVTCLIDYLLSGDASSIDLGNADLDFDGNVSITDVTELIDCLLSGTSMTTRETFTVNGVSFTMIRVPAGSFMMGATEEQGSDANSWERPVHEVTLSNSYLIGETEVTQELWLAVMGTNPSKHVGSFQKPVENVSWLDCQEFIAQLNVLTGCNFRLPTEAEWEYAARGANRSRGYKYAGSDDVADVGNVSSSTTLPVGSLQPNELNIYDMSGNVDEWVWDLFGYYTSEPQTDPTGPEEGSDHMYRGGSWYGGADVARVSYRFFRASTFKRGTMGLRLAL